MERLNAEEVVREQIDRQKVEIGAAAEAEKQRLEAQGEADAILAKYEAEAKGIRQVLDSKAEGYKGLVNSCAGDARAGATFLMTEKIEEMPEKMGLPGKRAPHFAGGLGLASSDGDADDESDAVDFEATLFQTTGTTSPTCECEWDDSIFLNNGLQSTFTLLLSRWWNIQIPLF